MTGRNDHHAAPAEGQSLFPAGPGLNGGAVPQLCRGFAAALALLCLLTACDDGPTVSEQYRADVSALAAAGLPGAAIPAAADSFPPVLLGALKEELAALAADLPTGENPSLILRPVPDGRDLALRIAFQPPERRTALSMCQGEPIGDPQSRRRSITIVAALCHDRRRLAAVRAVHVLSDTGDPVAETRQVIRAVLRRVFDLPYRP